jgi:ABC-type polar amino acid transport system ATPase subunit
MGSPIGCVSDTPEIFPNPDPVLACAQIHKAYGANEVLRGISAEFSPGTITSIVGPSGTGKSTLLRILSMLEEADQGSVTFEGETVSYPIGENRTSTSSPWPRLTTVFQQLFLWPHLTIRQNICLPVRGTDKTRPGGMVDQIMRDLMVTDFANRYPNEVSHGQRQRAAIARAIALEPQFLLLDEITSALDVEHVGIVLDYLQRLRDQGVGIVLITHLIGFARDAADQVIFMEHGHIVEAGPASILSEPQTARLRDFLSLVAQNSKSNGLLKSTYVMGALRSSFGQSQLSAQLPASSSLHRLISDEDTLPMKLYRQGLSDEESEFVASCLLGRLRSGEMPAEKDAAAINRYPFVDCLRQKIEEADLPWIMAAIDVGKPELAGLLISLLRKFSTRKEVVESLQSHWRSGNPTLKAHLLWRILDTPDLLREQKQEILDFILDHWAVFNRISSAFLGAAETIIPNALKRLADPDFPTEKKWAYLCRVIEPAADKQAAKALLTLHLNHEDEFMRHVARTLSERFFTHPTK